MKKAQKKATKKVATKQAAKPEVKATVKPEPKAKAEQPENKRITPGTPTKEWRMVKSARKSFKGWFVQGGIHREGNRGNEFVVGAEEKYTDLEKAKAALEAKATK